MVSAVEYPLRAKELLDAGAITPAELERLLMTRALG